ncbi:TetR family transcriptional regulator [Brevibacterium linens]|uniref:TetR family transcriptional regulator n=1 Tax=Brevibacterium linens TaxID=1703 RepID=UPI003BF614EE
MVVNSSAPTRRKDRSTRRQEILDAGCRIALSEGLSGITARRVASEAGIKSGLITYYFPSMDGLMGDAFSQVTAMERRELEAHANQGRTALERMRRTMAVNLDPSRDSIARLWLDAWRQAADRPILREVVIREMELDVADMEELVRAGVEANEFRIVDSPAKVAIRILALLDSQTVSSTVRTALSQSTLDYPVVSDMLVAHTERELGVAPGSLRLS